MASKSVATKSDSWLSFKKIYSQSLGNVVGAGITSTGICLGFTGSGVWLAYLLDQKSVVKVQILMNVLLVAAWVSFIVLGIPKVNWDVFTWDQMMPNGFDGMWACSIDLCVVFYIYAVYYSKVVVKIAAENEVAEAGRETNGGRRIFKMFKPETRSVSGLSYVNALAENSPSHQLAVVFFNC